MGGLWIWAGAELCLWSYEGYEGPLACLIKAADSRHYLWEPTMPHRNAAGMQQVHTE